jgi:hypothetical protein
MENYEVVGLIGKGSFGSVSKIRRKSDGRTLVWKEMNYGQMEEKEKQLLVQEVCYTASCKICANNYLIGKHPTETAPPTHCTILR